jgi:hypothetical protein
MQVEQRLIDPVDEAPDRGSGVQDDVDEIRAGEVLHVLNRFLDQPRLVPDIQTVELAERVVRRQLGHRDAQDTGRRSLDRLQSHNREEPDRECGGGLCPGV